MVSFCYPESNPAKTLHSCNSFLYFCKKWRNWERCM